MGLSIILCHFYPSMFFIGIDVAKAKLDWSFLLDIANRKRCAKTAANTKTGIELLA
jgi:hypothetical protein